jgi:putative transcriptional regulator
MVGHLEFPKKENGSLAGRLLIATPVVQGSCFERAVIYLCAHNESGAMGVIINYPVESMHLNEIFDQIGISAQTAARKFPVHFGGPVEANRGFIVHTGDYKPHESIIHEGGISVTASISILKDLAQGKGPEQGMLVLGYAGWSRGQLETEIETGSWIVAPASKQLMFDTGNDLKWNLAIASIGIDLGHLSTDVGHA